MKLKLIEDELRHEFDNEFYYPIFEQRDDKFKTDFWNYLVRNMHDIMRDQLNLLQIHKNETEINT